jgi:hypothetical protein
MFTVISSVTSGFRQLDTTHPYWHEVDANENDGYDRVHNQAINELVVLIPKCNLTGCSCDQGGERDGICEPIERSGVMHEKAIN